MRIQLPVARWLWQVRHSLRLGFCPGPPLPGKRSLGRMQRCNSCGVAPTWKPRRAGRRHCRSARVHHLWSSGGRGQGAGTPGEIRGRRQRTSRERSRPDLLPLTPPLAVHNGRLGGDEKAAACRQSARNTISVPLKVRRHLFTRCMEFWCCAELCARRCRVSGRQRLVDRGRHRDTTRQFLGLPSPFTDFSVKVIRTERHPRASAMSATRTSPCSRSNTRCSSGPSVWSPRATLALPGRRHPPRGQRWPGLHRDDRERQGSVRPVWDVQ